MIHHINMNTAMGMCLCVYVCVCYEYNIQNNMSSYRDEHFVLQEKKKQTNTVECILEGKTPVGDMFLSATDRLFGSHSGGYFAFIDIVGMKKRPSLSHFPTILHFEVSLVSLSLNPHSFCNIRLFSVNCHHFRTKAFYRPIENFHCHFAFICIFPHIQYCVFASACRFVHVQKPKFMRLHR